MIYYLVVSICVLGMQCKELTVKKYPTRTRCISARVSVLANNHDIRSFQYQADCFKLGEQRIGDYE